MKITSLYVTAANMDRAVGFYSKFLNQEPSIKEARFSSFDLDGFGFDIFAPAEDGEEIIIGNNVTPVFHTADLESEKERVKKLGCNIVLEQEINGYKLFQFNDSEGNILEIYTKI